MRKRAVATGITLVLMLALACTANAQTPYIAVYFDPGFSIWAKDCPGQVVDVWYVAAVNFNTWVTGAEFAVVYPPAVAWLADLDTPPVTIGGTGTGISMGYPTPLNGYSPLGLCRVQVYWMCDDCAPPYYGNEVKVIAHPHTAFLGWTDQNFTERPAVGRTSVICWCTPAEQTTWGRVKAIFGD